MTALQKSRQEAEKLGWGFNSVVERLPSKRKALGSVPSSEKKEKKRKKKEAEKFRCRYLHLTNGKKMLTYLVELGKCLKEVEAAP